MSRPRDLGQLFIKNFPAGLKAKYAARAEAEGTSFNHECVAVLAAHFKVKYDRGARASSGVSSTSRVSLVMPLVLRQKIAQAAVARIPKRSQEDVALQVLSEAVHAKAA